MNPSGKTLVLPHAKMCRAANLTIIHAEPSGEELNKNMQTTVKNRYEIQATRNRVQNPAIAAMTLSSKYDVARNELCIQADITCHSQITHDNHCSANRDDKIIRVLDRRMF